MTYDDYTNLIRAFQSQYDKTHGGAPVEPYRDVQAEVSGYGQPAGYAEAAENYQKYNTDRGTAWLKSLTPEQKAEYDALHTQRVKANQRKANLGALIAFGVPLGAATIGGLLGAGGLASGAGAGAGAGAYTTAAADSALASAAGGFSGLGGASLPSGVNLGSLGGIMSTGLEGAGIPLGGVLNGIGNAQVPNVGKLLNLGTQSRGINWGKLLGGAGLGAAALAAIQALQNRNKMPGLPNFTQLAEQTANSQNAAVNAQTLANRPNQMNAYGDTSTWTIGPDGRPMQTTQFSTANQQMLDQSNKTMAALQNQIAKQSGQSLQTPAMGSAMANALRTVRVV